MIAVSVAVNTYIMPTVDDFLQPARVARYLFTKDKERSSRLSFS
jgi:hypothetical protein